MRRALHLPTFTGRPAYVHLYGFAIARSEYSTKSKRRFRKSACAVNDPRRSTRRDTTRNPISAWFNHDVCFGTDANRIRWPASVKNALRVGTDFRTPPFPFAPNDATGTAHKPAITSTSVAEECVVRSSAAKTRPASGPVAIVRPVCAAKSSSVRVGCTVGAGITSGLAVRDCVPWRRYSNSRRSGTPGRIGLVGAITANARIPVFSPTDTA